MKKIVFTKGKYVFKAKRKLRNINSKVEKLTFEEEQTLPNGIAPCGNVLVVDDQDLTEALALLERFQIEVYYVIS